MLPRDERRFKRADLDGDLAADREEFTSFLHPEEFEHMKDIVVLVSPVQAHESSGWLERGLLVVLPCLLPLGDFTEATLLRLARWRMKNVF